MPRFMTAKRCVKIVSSLLTMGLVLCWAHGIIPIDNGHAALEPADMLTITTYVDGNEGHLITFPYSTTTLSVDCASGTITTLSHGDADHCPDGKMWGPDNVYPGQVLYSDESHGVTVTVVAANGDVIGGTFLGCSGTNSCSMALWVRYGGFDYLTTGDLDGGTEGAIADAFVTMGVNVDVLKVSHHGTCTYGTSSLDYFKGIKPEYATISGTFTSPCRVSDGCSIRNLVSAGVKRIYCVPAYNLSCIDPLPAQVRENTGALTISTDGSWFSITGSGFIDEDYVDDGPTPTPTETPTPTNTPTATPTWDARTPTNTPTPTVTPTITPTMTPTWDPSVPTPTPRHPWAMFHHDTMHTGRSFYAGPSNPMLAWSYRTNHSGLCSPALGRDGGVYVGSLDNNLYALNPDGTLWWSYASADDIKRSSPALGGDGRVYIGSDDWNFRAINSDGTLAWQIGIGQGNNSSTVGNDGTVYVSGEYPTGWLYAFNSDGTVKWRYYVYSTKSSAALGSDGKMYFGLATNNYISAINSNGTLAWNFNTGYVVHSSPALGSDGTVYFGAEDCKCYAVTSDGTLRWSYVTAGYVSSSPALGTDGRMYIGSEDSRFYAFNPNGTLAWSFKTRDRVGSSPALGSDGRTHVGSADNALYTLNSDGGFCWSFRTEDDVSSSPALGSDGRVYFGSNDSMLYCIGQSPIETPTDTPTMTPPPTDTPTIAPTPTDTPTITPTTPPTDTPTIAPTPTDTPTITPTTTPTDTPTIAPTPTDTPTTAPSPTPTTGIPPLVTEPGPLTAGQDFSMYVALTEDVTQPFDFYLFAETPAGVYTLYLNGKVTKGITPLYRNVKSLTKDFITTVHTTVRIPASMKGKTITFYAVIVQAGKKPPVRTLPDLTSSTPYVIMFDKKSETVN